MAKQKLNKTLIGGLTVVAAIVAVLSVAIVTMQQAKKDPTELAAKAKAAEDSREFNRVRPASCITVNKEGKYLVDAARVTYAAGELTGAIQLLNLAASQDPRNVAVLTAILERYWELVDGGLTSVADSMETHADNPASGRTGQRAGTRKSGVCAGTGARREADERQGCGGRPRQGPQARSEESAIGTAFGRSHVARGGRSGQATARQRANGRSGGSGKVRPGKRDQFA